MGWAHPLFDFLAFGVALLLGRWAQRTYGARAPLPQEDRALYLLVVIVTLVGGSLALGSLNMVLAHQPALAKSLIGGLAGGIVEVEWFKKYRGIRGSTGVIFVPGFAFGVALGRLGCFYGGLEDFTYGIPSSVPWALDFGDGIPRHPVQLYEAGAMLFFGLLFCATASRYRTFWIQRGFYGLVAFYAGQRFLWEFLKPYPSLLGPLNLFHLTALGLLIYAGMMFRSRTLAHA